MKKKPTASVLDKIQIDLGSADENNDKINCSNRKKRIHFKTLNVQLDGIGEKSHQRRKVKEIGKQSQRGIQTLPDKEHSKDVL
jgi:hypothetical protein